MRDAMLVMTTLSLTLASVVAMAGTAQPADQPAGGPGTQPIGEPVGLPVLTLTHDDTWITRSCRVVIPKGAIIADVNQNGVIQIAADGVTVEFEEGSELVGMAGMEGWEKTGAGAYDQLLGTGIVIRGASDVTLRGARVRGFRNGIVAENAPGLTIEDADLADLYRQRLGSTKTGEDNGDWLYPHNNDEGEWLENYGAALAIKGSDGLTVRRVRVRRSQNGIILDRVNDGFVYDNDCSFLSGWGIAMWRSSGNTVSRNALDYCVRGHSEGVYNRGQDSAGLLMFEQCNDNMILENSATHSGDGVFAFAGNEALGQTEPVRPIDYTDVGVNRNVFARNRLSYNSAHGLELTFSEDNIVVDNTFEGNGICGIWGGYSQDTRVHANRFAENGGMAYGLERGGINAEHASGWLIDSNTFTNDRCAIHFWIDSDETLLGLPGVRFGYRGVDGNQIVRNRIVIDKGHPFGEDARLVGVHVRRDISDAENIIRPMGTNWLLENEMEIDPDVGQSILNDQAQFLHPEGSPDDMVWFAPIPDPAVLGDTTPVADSASYGDRSTIVMGPWGPWDFESPLFRPASRTSSKATYELFVPEGFEGEVAVETLAGPKVRATRAQDAGPTDPFVLTVEATEETPVTAYAFRVIAGREFSRTGYGSLVKLGWDLRLWAWSANPIEDREAWLAEGEPLNPVRFEELNFPFGYGGPPNRRQGEDEPAVVADGFGLLADTTITLPKGNWRVVTLSDDGVRVRVNGKTVIDRWDVHGPTPDAAVFSSDGTTPTTIRVEYFEMDGFATLRVGLEPV